MRRQIFLECRAFSAKLLTALDDGLNDITAVSTAPYRTPHAARCCKLHPAYTPHSHPPLPHPAPSQTRAQVYWWPVPMYDDVSPNATF